MDEDEEEKKQGEDWNPDKMNGRTLENSIIDINPGEFHSDSDDEEEGKGKSTLVANTCF